MLRRFSGKVSENTGKKMPQDEGTTEVEKSGWGQAVAST